MEWKVVTVKLRDLKPWERNPRRMGKKAAERLLRSWEEFGQVQTIAIGPDGEVYDGHQRLSVLKAAYGDDYEVLALQASRPLTEEERERLVLLLHAGAMGGWDWDVLAGWDADSLRGGGLDEAFREMLREDLRALGSILARGRGNTPVPQVDRAEELRERWKTERGQLWRIPSRSIDGYHFIICGDCTDQQVIARVMRGEMADLVCTSPPYWVGKEYERDVTFQEHLALLRAFGRRAVEATKPGGFIVINFSEIYSQSRTAQITGRHRQDCYPISKDYYQIFHDELLCDLYAMRIWYKPFGRLKQPFWTYHTSVPHHYEWEWIWTWRTPGVPHYDEWEWVWTWRTPGGEGDRCFDWEISVRAVWDTSRGSDSPLKRHVAAFPADIPEAVLRAHSAPGAVVLDPFLGSGTTIVACERLGRLGRGVEIEPKYVAVALECLAEMGLMPELVEGV